METSYSSATGSTPRVSISLRALLLLTGGFAVAAAAAGFAYRAASPSAQQELLAFLGGLTASGFAGALLQWRQYVRRLTGRGIAHFKFRPVDRLLRYNLLYWSPTGGLSWLLLAIAVSLEVVVLNMAWLLEQRLEALDAVGPELALGLCWGIVTSTAIGKVNQNLIDHLWIRLCEHGVVAFGNFIPWEETEGWFWDAEHREWLVFSTRERMYAVTVPQRLRAEVQQFLRGAARGAVS